MIVDFFAVVPFRWPYRLLGLEYVECAATASKLFVQEELIALWITHELEVLAADTNCVTFLKLGLEI